MQWWKNMTWIETYDWFHIFAVGKLTETASFVNMCSPSIHIYFLKRKKWQPGPKPGRQPGRKPFSQVIWPGAPWPSAATAAYWVRFTNSSTFTISDVAADWHKLMVLECIMRPSIAQSNGQLDPQCSYNQHTATLSLQPIAQTRWLTTHIPCHWD